MLMRHTKLIRLLLLGISTTTFGVFALTIGISLFLSHAGAQYLPLSYILMGLLSIPLYTWLSQIVDHTSRPKLFRYLLIIAISISCIFRLLVNFEHASIYYLIHISFYFQWILVGEVLFPSLVSDYFTSLDWKHYTSEIRMSMAIGGLLGGLLTSLLAQFLAPKNLLLCLPCLYFVVFLQLFYLEKTEQTLEITSHQEDEINLWENLQSLPKILQSYPIISCLASSTFLFIVLYSLAEFQYFTIYSQTFTDDRELTNFLGFMRVVNNVIPFVVLYFFTRPLIEQLGVIQMNLIYPITSLASFTGLAFNFSLSTAVIANLNSDGLDDSINQPIHNLNYNAVPYSLMGRVRAISNGLFYSFGLATAGVILWFSQILFRPEQITRLAIILSTIFLIIRYLMGKSYLQSLLSMLRSGSVKLDDVSEGLNRLPSEYLLQVQDLLKSEDIHEQILGLELAYRVENPQKILRQIKPLMFTEDERVHQALVKFLSHIDQPDIKYYLLSQLDSENQLLQLISLEALVSSKQPLKDTEIRRLLRTTFLRLIKGISQSKRDISQNKKIHSLLLISKRIKVLTCLVAQQNSTQDPEIQGACALILDSEMDQKTKLLLIRNIHNSSNREFIPLVKDLVLDGDSAIKREGLDTLASLGSPQDRDLATLGAQEINNSDPLVRAAAFKLLGVVRSPYLLHDVAQGLENPNLAVRLWAASALANYGNKSLSIAKTYLSSPRLEVIEAAIAAIAKVRTFKAINLLYQHLQPDYQALSHTRQILAELPEQDYRLFVKVILEDYHERIVHRVLYVLSLLDHEGTFSEVRQILQTKDPRLRANAVETLASFKYRRFVLPVLPLLENKSVITKKANFDFETCSLNLLKSNDYWLRISAILCLYGENQHFLLTSLKDSHLLVQTITSQLINSEGNLETNFYLKRLFFLKNIPFLANLFLDEILIIDRHLKQHCFLPGEIICTADNLVDNLYLIYQGRVKLYEDSQVSKLSAGDYFGEMALFEYFPLYLNAIAETESSIFILSREGFASLVEICPRFLLCFSQATKN